MSASTSKRVTAESKLRAALTMAPLLADAQGSSENSLAAKDIAAPILKKKKNNKETF